MNHTDNSTRPESIAPSHVIADTSTVDGPEGPRTGLEELDRLKIERLRKLELSFSVSKQQCLTLIRQHAAWTGEGWKHARLATELGCSATKVLGHIGQFFQHGILTDRRHGGHGGHGGHGHVYTVLELLLDDLT